MDSVFDSEGSCIDMSDLYDLISEDNYIDIYPISLRKIACELNISLQTVVTGMESLRKYRYIRDNYIYVNKELLENGYITLYVEKEIKGELLIFYSYIKHRSFKYKDARYL